MEWMLPVLILSSIAVFAGLTGAGCGSGSKWWRSARRRPDGGQWLSEVGASTQPQHDMHVAYRLNARNGRCGHRRNG